MLPIGYLDKSCRPGLSPSLLLPFAIPGHQHEYKFYGRQIKYSYNMSVKLHPATSPYQTYTAPPGYSYVCNK